MAIKYVSELGYVGRAWWNMHAKWVGVVITPIDSIFNIATSTVIQS